MDDTETLLHLARSGDFSERARAGTELSLLAGSETVDRVLVELLLDDENTSVTQATAEALITRGDRAALRPFAVVWHLVESRTEDSPLAEIGDYLYGAVSLGRWLDATDARRTGLRTVLAALLDDHDQAVRKGAESLIGLLDGTRPPGHFAEGNKDRGADHPDRQDRPAAR